MPTRQVFRTVDRLRLEIGAPPAAGLVNRVANPSGERGAWGYTIASAQTTLTSSRTAKDYRPGGTLTLTSTVAVAPSAVVQIETEPQTVTAGHHVGGSFRLVSAGPTVAGVTLSVRLVFRDAAGQEIATGSPMSVGNGAVASAYGIPQAVAPAGVASAHLRLTLTSASTVLRQVQFREVMWCSSTVSGDVTSPAYVEPLVWTDVLAPALEIETDRTPLGLGILTARIRSASLDPATSTLVRPGRPIRLMAYTTGALGWEPLFWGKIQDGRTTYDQAYPIASKRALIVVSATDAADDLANTSSPASHKQIRSIREKVRTTGVPFEIDTTTENKSSTDTVVAVNENASVLDQVALTRDTARSYAAVTRFGVLRAIDRQYMNGIDNQTSSPHDPMVATFTPADYNQNAVIDFDTRRLVNTVLIQCRYIKEDGTTTDGVFGPYVDQASVREWGAFQATYTIAGVEDTNSLKFRAGEILKETATPTRRISELTFPVTDEPAFYNNLGSNLRVHLDLLDRVTVQNATAGINAEHRISGLKHIITPNKWLVRVSFGSQAGTPTPRPQAAIPTGQSQLLPDTPWVTVTLLNGYTHFDGPSAPVQYRRLGGVVYLRGLLSGGNAAGLDAFILPPGFRGTWVRGNQHWQCTRNDVPFLVRTWTTGAVQPTLTSGYMDLSQIIYPAEA